MEFLYIFLGCLVAVPVIMSIGTLIGNRKNKSDTAKLTNYFTNEGKADIEKIELYMKSNNIEFPDKSDNVIKYVNALLSKITAHYYSIWSASLSKSRYKYGGKINGFGSFYYNSKTVLIYDDVVHVEPFLQKLEVVVKSEVQYKHTNAKRDEQYWNLEQLLDHFKSLGEPKAHITLARSIPRADFFWYVEYPESMGSRTFDVGAGAVVGGVLLGPAGALIGASSTAKHQEKEIATEMSVIVGQRSVEYWRVAKGESASKDAIETLDTSFPKNRYKDSYKNHS